MTNKNLLKSLLGLVWLSFVGKFLSLLARLIMARALMVEAMSYFALINPLMVLLLNLSQFGLPLACSTLIAKHPEKTRKLFVTSFLVSVGISLLLMALVYFLAPILARDMLHSPGATLAVYGLGLLVPLVALSSMLKAIYIGRGDVVATTYSTVAEESSRIVFLVFGIALFTSKGPEYGALGAVIGMCVGEIGQSVFLYIRAPRRVKRSCAAWLFEKENDDLESARDLFRISVPATAARLIASLTYFLEPIIYTNMLQGTMDPALITRSYGILTGYAMPLLLMPGFFSAALANYLLPQMASAVEKGRFGEARSLFRRLTGFCLALGFAVSLGLFFGATPIMKLLYGSAEGAEYVRILAFPFLIYYIETPIINAMHALGKTGRALRSTLLSSVVRLAVLASSVRALGIYAVALSTVLGAFIDILFNLIDVVVFFHRHDVKA